MPLTRALQRTGQEISLRKKVKDKVADQLKKQQLQRLVADLEAKTLEVTEIKETLYLIKEEK
jgi:hypothetical protein